MKDYSWELNDSLCEEKVIDEEIPSRFAITLTGIIMRDEKKNGCSEILLCNPHPTSWNMWVLPYGAFLVDRTNVFMDAVKYSDLSDYLFSLREEYSDQYEKEALKQMSEIIKTANVELSDQIIHENFSLKFSKSANIWTAYNFLYHTCKLPENSLPNIDYTWFPLSRQNIDEATTYKKHKKLSIADNLMDLLNKQKALNKIVNR